MIAEAIGYLTEATRDGLHEIAVSVERAVYRRLRQDLIKAIAEQEKEENIS